MSRMIYAFMGLLLLAAVIFAHAQGSDPVQTMRPVIRGRHAAVASMKAESTEAARRILDAGGNAFDAAVAGQAALAVTDFSLNGVGSDTVLLVYNAREKKVYSINGEPRAPKLATIDWYEKNNGGKIPESDGLLSGGIPGVVDAWYTLLDRWGTMLAAAAAGLEVSEYSPLTIKSSVVGYGRAEKQQVQHMVVRLLDLAAPPETHDASDALAIAICHLHTMGTLERQRAAAR